LTLVALPSSYISSSAGQVGPVSRFLNDPSAPERKDASTLGQALFDNESFDTWADLYKINTFSIFFVTNAFLGLLDKGSREIEGYTSSVINITSISGITKLAQRHVRAIHRVMTPIEHLLWPVLLQQRKKRRISPDKNVVD
jgi:NAD(P)-dependent dehydrogenase (short-subunit alcohol dehydrogenase family)